MPSATLTTRIKLRKELRTRRRALSKTFKHRASQRITRLLMRSGWLRPGLRIGIYMAMEEELSLADVIHTSQQLGCSLFVPHVVSARRRHMLFYPFHPTAPLIKHRWGMLQLANATHPVITTTLDLVLVPLVGFDDRGNRLGMGGGFYDRHFSHRRRPHLRKPKLIGVAFACQKISSIEVQLHDIQLDALVTERGVTRFGF